MPYLVPGDGGDGPRRTASAGHVLALLSSSARAISPSRSARDLGIEHLLVTQLVVVDGRFTGRGGDAGLLRARQGATGRVRFAAEHGIDLAASYFYTDSVTDLPVLERVGEHPRVVNPDPLLRRVAAAARLAGAAPRAGPKRGTDVASAGGVSMREPTLRDAQRAPAGAGSGRWSCWRGGDGGGRRRCRRASSSGR